MLTAIISVQKIACGKLLWLLHNATGPQRPVEGSAMPIYALARLHQNAKYSILRHHWPARPQSR